jgi:anaerobic sulfite reductase subunit C
MEEKKKQTEVDLKNLKAGGYIKERGRDRFTVRLRVPGGRLPVERLKKIAEVAGKYGGEFVHLSVRQSLELVNVDFADFDAVAAELGEAGQVVASCGARVRVPIACGGCEYNPNGLVDTQQSALEVDQKLFGTATGHHKFKTGFSGCPHDCLKAAINDVGFIGAVQPDLNKEECIKCGLCVKSCSEGAIVEGVGGTPDFLPEKCIFCGDCIKVCPSGSWRALRNGYTVYAGGKWGRYPLVGTPIAAFLPAERVVEFIEEILAWYKEKAEGLGRIRLGQIILREGIDSLLERLRVKFQEYVEEETFPPQEIRTKAGAGD